MRVLVTGAGGQLGHELVAAFDGHEVFAFGRTDLDVTDRDAVLQFVGGLSPDAVVHAAAWTAVDECEHDPDRAFQVNALGTRHVAEAARRSGAHVCYVSTDFVFDGRSSRPYTEWDDTNPISVYGRSKLAGEREIDPGWSVVRTSSVYGHHGGNFVKAVIARAAAGEPFGVVADQRRCATSARDLAGMIRRLVVARLPGVFHVTNQGATTRFDLAVAAVEAAGLDGSIIEPTSSGELAGAARRPAYSVLDNAALRLSGNPLLDEWRHPLETFVKELIA